MTERVSPLAPFRVRSFRFQWPADLATSWAFEMEALILGWYILIATGSVKQLVIFGALAWVGALFSPFFGIASDRIGVRAIFCVTRGLYAVLASLIMVLTLTDSLQPWHVFCIAALVGLMRPSDQVLRNVLVSQTVSPQMLMGALAVSRTTYDSAKVAGAFAGAGGVALVGMGPAYALVTALYVVSFCLSFGVGGAALRDARGAPGAPGQAAASVLHGMQEGVRYIWQRTDVLGGFTMAFLVNLLAYPFVLGLLPYVAKEVYSTGQAGLGYLAAAFAFGALVGSLGLGARRMPLAAGRVMLVSGVIWFLSILLLPLSREMAVGLALLFAAGLAQSYVMTPLAAVMLRSSGEHMRGRVMGMRMLAVWGLPLGLLAAGPIIDFAGFTACVLLYGGLGLAATVAMGIRWRSALWEPSAAANAPR